MQPSSKRVKRARLRLYNKKAVVTSAKFSLRDDQWLAVVIEGDLKSINEENAAAITYPQDKVIVFSLDHLNLGTVIHELYHAHCHYFYLNSAAVGRDRFEEINAEFWEENLFRFGKLARELLRTLSRKNGKA